jgi:ABC transporter transmembrane region
MAESDRKSVVAEDNNTKNKDLDNIDENCVSTKIDATAVESQSNGMSEIKATPLDDAQMTNEGKSEIDVPSKVRFENESEDNKDQAAANNAGDEGDIVNRTTATESNTSDLSMGTPTDLDDKKAAVEIPAAVNATAKKQHKIQSGTDLKVSERALEDRANCLSVWLLSYLTPLLRLGSHKLLDQDDVGVPPDADRADRVYNLTFAVWQKQAAKCRVHNKKLHDVYKQKLDACGTNDVKRKKLLAKPPVDKEPSIAGSIVSAFGLWSIILSIIYYVISALLGFVPVMILNDLVKYFQTRATNEPWDGFAPPWVEVVALGVVPVLVSLLQTRNQVIMSHCAVFVRTAVSTMLYRKALRVSAAGRAKTSTGQVVNMMSNDTAQLQRFLQFIGMTLVAPLQIVIALVLIYQQVSLSYQH